MKRARTAGRLILALISTSCVDTTPYRVSHRTADAAQDAPLADASWRKTCTDCIATEPTCQLSQCTTDAKCGPFAECIFDYGCVSYADLGDRVACAQTCFKKFGILDFSDPTLTVFFPINACSTAPMPCSSACVVR